ncbi:hypothetical protein ACW14Y_30285 [Kitasatospora sp. cg17-2]
MVVLDEAENHDGQPQAASLLSSAGTTWSSSGNCGGRSDGATLYSGPSGNIYANEGSHWGVTFTG